MSQGFYGFPNILGLLRATNLRLTGKAGPTAGAGLAGGTTSGAPTSGQFDVGEAVIDQTGALWICTVAGSPGTFVQAGFANPMTTQGDLIGGGLGGAPQRLALGRPGQQPAPVGADVAWLSPTAAGGVLDPTTTDGDLIYRKATTVSTLSLGFVGDSITAGSSVTTPPSVTAVGDLGTAQVTVSGSNQGHAGATSADWVPGASSGYLSAAKSAFAAAGVRLVHVMLGTNDAKTAVATSPSAYRANLLLLIDDLLAAGYIVSVSYPPYLAATTGGFDSASAGRVLSYTQQIDLLTDGGHILAGDTGASVYFQATPGALQSDGIHPTQAGSDTLAGLWATALRRAVNALGGQTELQRLAVGAGLAISGGTLSASAPLTLAADGDVSISSPATGQTLRYSAADGLWHNVSPLSTMHWDILTDGAGSIIFAAGDTVGVGTLG